MFAVMVYVKISVEMAEQEVKESGRVNRVMGASSSVQRLSWLMRVLAAGATLAATLVMALNKERKTIVVATFGTTPVQATLTARFHHIPAFIFFVIANGLATIHNLVMLGWDMVGPTKYDTKGHRFIVTAVLDMLNVALVSGGASAAAFMGQLGRDGNSHTRWNKICDKFETYCEHASGALLASFIAMLLLIIITILSILKLRTN